MMEKEGSMTEDETIQRCQAGDREAFRSIVNSYRDVLYGTAYLMIGNRMLAEDQVQEAFLAAWESIGSFRTGRPLKPWLVRILVNKVLSYRRANSVPVLSFDPALVSQQAMDDLKDAVEMDDQLQRGLLQLSEEQRQVVLLRYFTGLSLAETSAALKRREGTVKSQAHRALEMLRNSIESENRA